MTIMLLTSSALPAVKDDLGKIIDEGERLDIFSGIIMASYDGNTVFKESVGLSNKNMILMVKFLNLLKVLMIRLQLGCCSSIHQVMVII